MSFKLLIIEDEAALLETIKINLELEGYIVETCHSGEKAVGLIEQFNPDLILLDIMLPKLSGTDIFKQIRTKGIKTPVVFLTAKNLIYDKIEGLKLGAEDYITKPFDLEELLLRINIILKRNYPENSVSDIFKFKNFEINFSTYQVVGFNNKKETLTKREIAFLKLLVEHTNKVISRDEILEKLWAKDENPSSRTIDNYILNFRKIFEANQKEPVHFLSIRGVGYKFCE